MSKAARNRAIRRQALAVDPSGNRTKAIARALRRHGRMPLEFSGWRVSTSQPAAKWTSRARRWTRKHGDFRKKR